MVIQKVLLHACKIVPRRPPKKARVNGGIMGKNKTWLFFFGVHQHLANGFSRLLLVEIHKARKVSTIYVTFCVLTLRKKKKKNANLISIGVCIDCLL